MSRYNLITTVYLLFLLLSFCIYAVSLYRKQLSRLSLYTSRFNEGKASLIPLQFQDIEDKYARDMIEKIEFRPITLSSKISEPPVLTTCLEYSSTEVSYQMPLVLIHGFDSSCLEFRRLAPKLASRHPVYVPDILGWGFNDCSNVKDFSPAAKLEHLKQFLLQVVQRKCVLVGASLGGGIAINLATEICPELVEKVVLLDAQGFIDGKGPSNLPRFIAK